MTNIAIKDLEINEELDSKALENLLGGRWVRRRYTRRFTRWYTRRIRQRFSRVSYYYRTRTIRYARSFTRTFTRLVWV